jgi:protein O-mannosyl-transferase
MKLATKNIKWFVLLILVVAGFFVYFNSFSNKLFWDDDDGITNNLYIKDWSYFPRYFSENLIAGAGQVSNYWRPLILISFAVDYHVFGLAPFGYHLTNLFWHVLAAWLIYLLFYKLSKRHWLSFWPALIFLIHPLQTEAVTYVSGRADPMGAVFVLLSLLTYIIYRQHRSKIFISLSLLSFIGALLSKEQSIMLPALIFITEFFFFFDKHKWRESLALFLPFALISVGYFLARIFFLNFNDLLSGVDYVSGYDNSLKTRLLTFTYVFVKYLALLFAPFNLHMAYEVKPITSFWSWPVALFVLAASVFGYIIKKYWHKDKLLVFGLAWFLLMLLPRTNIISINRPLYEHWLYLPMAGFWLAIILLVEKLKIKKEILLVVLSIFCIFFITLTIKRNFEWRDPITFYEKNLSYTPNSFIQHNNLGMAYADAGRADEAIREYKTAISIADIYPQVHYNLANTLVTANRLEEAEKEYYKSINISPGFSLPYINLIKISIFTKDEIKLKTALILLKANFTEEYYLNQAFYGYYSFGDGAKARVIGQELIKKYPNDSDEVSLLMLNIR